MALVVYTKKQNKQKKNPLKIQCHCLFLQTIMILLVTILITDFFYLNLGHKCQNCIFLKERGERGHFYLTREPLAHVSTAGAKTHMHAQHLQRKSTKKSPRGALAVGRLLSFIELKRKEYRVKTPSPKQEECTDCCYSYQITTPQGLIMR